MQPGSCREAAVSSRSISAISARSSWANLIRTVKLIMESSSSVSEIVLSLDLVQRRNKLRKNHCLVAVGPGRHHADLRAALTLLETQVLLCGFRQVIKICNPLGRSS